MKRKALSIGALVTVALSAAIVVVAVDHSAQGGSAARSAVVDWDRAEARSFESEFITWDSDLTRHECCEGAVSASELSRTGGLSFRSMLKYGDPPVADGTRAETHTAKWEESRFSSGDTVYYGFSVYIVSSWETDEREDIVFQWHNQPDDCEDQKFPSAFLTALPNGTWRLRVNSDDAACTTSATIMRNAFDLAELKPGSWNDFVFKFDWDHTDEGGIEVWHQTDKSPGWSKVLDITGANTFNDDPGVSGYLKWGLYKPAWNDGPTAIADRMIFHDNIAFGGSFAAVDPSVAR